MILGGADEVADVSKGRRRANREKRKEETAGNADASRSGVAARL
jgi:hypothetical protein